MSDKAATEAERLKRIQQDECYWRLRVFIQELERSHGRPIVARALKEVFNDVSGK
jgi:hypothetical protein